jgi:hypothetical protein
MEPFFGRILGYRRISAKVRGDLLDVSPESDVERPTINRDEGGTAAFSAAEARKLLDAPPAQ